VCGGDVDERNEPHRPTPSPSPVPRTVDDGTDNAILEAMIKGNRVHAILLYREKYGVSMAEAKKFIDNL
jgi:ribosomal protein L7/L12